jgi:3-oxoacyl-[acyl-carrier-protein] synthase-3
MNLQTDTLPRAVIRSTGAYLPERILTNDELARMVDTSDEWIVQRTGIKQRHIAASDETTGDMAFHAAQMALQRGNLSPQEIDTVIVATTTPDQTFPSVAVQVQDRLGLPYGAAFDVQAVCSGFIYGLATANSFIRSGQSQRVLLIGAEKMSALIDWADRTTCVLFADGAGAVVVEAGAVHSSRGIMSTHLHARGDQRSMLCTSGGPATTQTAGKILMQGREVFKYAVTCMSDVVRIALTHNQLTPADIDWLVPHQANIRIIEATAEKLGLPMDKIIVTVDRHGNTSAASIPLALHEAVAQGRIVQNQLVLLEAMGGGFTWGAALLRF